MIKNYINSILFFLLSLSSIHVLAYSELDRIIAVVNKDVITYRDIEKGINEALLFFEQNSITPPDQNIIEKKVMDELIEQKLIEGFATEMNIKASQEDIDALIKNILVANEISLDELKKNLEGKGSDIEKLIESLKYEIILKKVKNREISSKINISDYEVQKHKEKLAITTPDIYDISHILIKFPNDPSSENKKEKRNLAQEIFAKLKTQEFEKIAYQYSDAPDAKEGGSLGRLRQSELPAIFIEHINNLKAGEYSLPFESNNGLHIIKINQIESLNQSNNTSEKIKKYFVRQIVLKTSEVSPEDDVLKKLNRFINEINSGADFGVIAKKYSEDYSSINGGEIGWLSEGMDKLIDNELSKIDKNEISKPFKTNLGWHIIQYTDFKFDDLSKENIDKKIKFDLVNERTELLFQDWYSALKASSYIEIRNE